MPLRPLTSIVTACGLVLCLAACDQSDPEDLQDTSDASTASVDIDLSELSNVGPSEHTYPLVAGSTWVYAHTGGSEPWQETVELTQETVAGDTVLLLSDTPGPSGSRSESVLWVDAEHVAYRVSKQTFVGATLQFRAEYNPGFARHDLKWTLREEGYTETLEYGRKEWDGDGQLTRDGERAHNYTIEAQGVEVSVPAGDFVGCMVVHRMRERGTDTADESDNKRYWYCPGVGKVREVEDETGKMEELVSCDIPGGGC